MKRRCFVVSGEVWARIYALVEREGATRPRWTRVEALFDDGAVRGLGPAARAEGSGAGAAAGMAVVDGDRGRFAGNVIHAAGAAMRATAAEELVLVAPPLVLASLRAYERVLAGYGIATTMVPMAISLLIPATEQPLLDGAVARSFSFASAALSFTQAA